MWQEAFNFVIFTPNVDVKSAWELFLSLFFFLYIFCFSSSVILMFICCFYSISLRLALLYFSESENKQMKKKHNTHEIRSQSYFEGTRILNSIFLFRAAQKSSCNSLLTVFFFFGLGIHCDHFWSTQLVFYWVYLHTTAWSDWSLVYHILLYYVDCCKRLQTCLIDDKYVTFAD